MNIPESKEIDYDNSTIVYKPIRKSLAWEDLGGLIGAHVDSVSNVHPCHGMPSPQNANVYRTKEQCKASLAQAKLTQVMAAANGDWVADWMDKKQSKFCVPVDYQGLFFVQYRQTAPCFLAFKTEELAQQAMEDNAQILEEYKPLAGG